MDQTMKPRATKAAALGGVLHTLLFFSVVLGQVASPGYARAGEEASKAKQGTTKEGKSPESLGDAKVTHKCPDASYLPPRLVTISAKGGVLNVDFPCVGVWKDAPHTWMVADLDPGYSLQIELSSESGKKGPFKWNSATHPGNPRRGVYETKNQTRTTVSTPITTETCDVPSRRRFNYTITLRDPNGVAQRIDPGVIVVDGPLEGKH